MLRRIIVVFALLAGIAVISQSFVAAGGPQDPNARGRKLYGQYCASCHGVDGKGMGPVASSFKTAVPDLTTIAQRDGKFDLLKVQNIIAGEVTTPAHGTVEMPVWGYIFRRQGDKATSTLNVHALAKYIEAMQKK